MLALYTNRHYNIFAVKINHTQKGTKMLNANLAVAALAAHANANTISQQQVKDVLGNSSTTFAQVVYVAKQPTAAKFKHLNIQKVVSANVQLFSNINEFTSVYANAVKRTASKIEENSKEAVAEFKAQANWFEHTDCYSLVAHKTTGVLYVYAIYNNASSLYFIDGVAASKQEVAEYCTASERTKLLGDNTVVRNATHDVLHTVKVRTIELANFVSLTANKQTLTVA